MAEPGGEVAATLEDCPGVAVPAVLGSRVALDGGLCLIQPQASPPPSAPIVLPPTVFLLLSLDWGGLCQELEYSVLTCTLGACRILT